MIDLHISVEQENRERQGFQEPTLNTGLYSEGYFEGYTGGEPSHPEDCSYWLGYQIGCREYWAKRLGVEIPIEIVA